MVGVYIIWNFRFRPQLRNSLYKKLQALMHFNPMYQFLTAARSIVVYGQRPSFTTLGILGLIGIVTLAIGAFVFKKKQDKFIYYV